jgi:phosphatidylserine/phosphatidylglycerophosphate/cardiolipin synthase-like enzyme
MRQRVSVGGLTLGAIAGTNVVLLTWNMPRELCEGLRGFAIHRTDHRGKTAFWLQGQKTFAETDPGGPPGSKHSLRDHPAQDFTWSDYTANPGYDYTYRVLALKGPVNDLQPIREVSVDIQTESPDGGDHDIYFNRGAAASQEFVRRFGNREPGAQGGDADPAWKWLSRGAHEAILAFVGRAKSSGWGLRICAYEFRLPSVIDAVRAAHERGADVRVLYDAGKEFPRDENRTQVAAGRIEALAVERVPMPQALSHNKFIVLLKNGRGEAVLTGSTNFSLGGVFGQSNVVHIVEDPKVAEAYLACWNQLSGNPTRKDLGPWFSASLPIDEGFPSAGTTTVFSPRSKIDALEFYARQAGAAEQALFMTFAFGMGEIFKQVYRSGKAPLRYALLEKLLGPGVRKSQLRAATQEMKRLRFLPANRFAVGNRIELNAFDNWLGERLSGLNTHVKYIHTKYMITDPLGPDPVVITGSANFSAASSDKNDENMLVIRGNRRVADIYLGEFMRLWSHNAFREWAASKRRAADPLREPWHLDETDEWWQRRFANPTLTAFREYFSS